jgi:DNA invertase Pin-like site-specific DNA recombinase
VRPCRAPRPALLGVPDQAAEHIDTTTPGGKLIFHVFAALAEFERDLIGERTKAGLQAARARGRRGGRKRVLTAPQIALAKSMKADPHNSIADICATLKISKRTLYRYTGEYHAETARR